MLTWLLILSPFIAGYVIYRVYQKKNAEREAASSKRFDEIFGNKGKTPPSLPSSHPSSTSQSVPSPAPSASHAPVAPLHLTGAWSAREKFIEPQGKLIYYLLKSSLPDHEVFAQVPVSALVVATQAGRKAVDALVDFVVCDKQMKPVSAIRLAGAAGFDAAGEIVQAAGIRWVRITPDALPARNEIRAVVLGG